MGNHLHLFTLLYVMCCIFFISSAEKRAAAQMAAASSTKTTMSYTTAIMTSGKPTKIVTSTTTQTFAAKLTEATATLQLPSAVASATVSGKSRSSHSQMGPTQSLSTTSAPSQGSCPQQVTVTASSVPSPKHHRPLPATSAPPCIPGQYQMTPGKAPFSSSGPICMSNPPSQVPSATASVASSAASSSNQGRSSTPLSQPSDQHQQQAVPLPVAVQASTPLEYSLFNDTFTKVRINKL